jgi:hypothetical protein
VVKGRRTENIVVKGRRTDNTVVKGRTDNTVVKGRTDNTVVKGRRTTDNTVAKGRRTTDTRQTMIYKYTTQKTTSNLNVFIVVIYVYWCPTRFLYHTMFVSLKSNTTGVTREAGTV